MDAFGGPVILTMLAGVLVILKYRRRAARRRSLLSARDVPGLKS